MSRRASRIARPHDRAPAPPGPGRGTHALQAAAVASPPVQRLAALVQLATARGVVQRQQTDVCLKSASGTYTLGNVVTPFAFAEDSKGSDVITTTGSHPKGYVDYTSIAEKYLRKQKVIPKDATAVTFTDCTTYGIKK